MIDKLKKLISNDKDINYWDVRIEKVNSNSISAWNGKLKNLEFSESTGLSIRLYNKGRVGFASSTFKKLDDDLLKELINKAKKLSYLSNHVKIKEYKQIKDNVKINQKINVKDISFTEKKNLVVDNSIIKDTIIKSKVISYFEANKIKEFYNSENTEIKQELNYIYAGSSSSSYKNERNESYDKRVGGLGGFEIVKDEFSKISKETDTNAVDLLSAKIPKAGKYNLIFDGALTDVFIHEALGHACESDLVLVGDSILKNKLNKKIGNDIVNVYDDPTLENQWGSFFYDDEGVKTQKTELLKNGVLKNYLTNRETASNLNLGLTGNSRAMSFSYLPIVRMSNTYIEKGDSNFDEMLKELKDGIYLRGSRGGQVDTFKGNFHFSAMDGFMVEGGKLKQRLTNVSLGGFTLNLLKNIRLIENKYNEGFPGYCGKGGQSVPVIGHCPHILVDDILVGGE